MFFHTVFAISKAVFQTPLDLFGKHGDSSELQCSHRISGYSTILWYNQTRNTEVQFRGHLFGSQSQPEPEFRNIVTLTGNGYSNGALTIKSLTPNDSAEYFCTALTHCFISHPFTKTTLVLNKLTFLTTWGWSASAYLHSVILTVRENVPEFPCLFNVLVYCTLG